MKRWITLFSVLPVALGLSVASLAAQHGAGGNHGAASHAHAMGRTSGSHTPKTPDQLLAQNSKLTSKLEALLPAGTNVQTAAQGFRNLGQFVAAVHVSHNLGIPFDELKAKMTDPPRESLGKAIQTLKPEADAKTETNKAMHEARSDLRNSRS